MMHDEVFIIHVYFMMSISLSVLYLVAAGKGTCVIILPSRFIFASYLRLGCTMFQIL